MAQHRLTGQFTVDLPPDQAFRLFTARGEQDWVEHWRPRFPDPAADDTVAGTVFETDAHGGTTTWIVAESKPGRLIRYARFTPPTDAGMVTVELGDAGGYTDVTVTYELTALTDAGRDRLQAFALDYPAFLGSWQDAIAAALR